jgi:hypothetical protein
MVLQQGYGLAYFNRQALYSSNATSADRLILGFLLPAFVFAKVCDVPRRQFVQVFGCWKHCWKEFWEF